MNVVNLYGTPAESGKCTVSVELRRKQFRFSVRMNKCNKFRWSHEFHENH